MITVLKTNQPESLSAPANWQLNSEMYLLPISSRALFLKGVMTVPSFLLRRGLLLLSATFCFNLERTFRFGSEAVKTQNTTNYKANILFHMCSFKIKSKEYCRECTCSCSNNVFQSYVRHIKI